MGYDFTKLDVWKESIEFCKNLYPVLSGFPSFEDSNIISQLRRAGVSISTNIAEGGGKFSTREQIAFLRIAQASSKECMSLMILSEELGFAKKEDSFKLLDQLEHISKMLTLLINRKLDEYRLNKEKEFDEREIFFKRTRVQK